MHNLDGRTRIQVALVLTPQGDSWTALCVNTASVAQVVADCLGGRVALVDTTLAQLIDAGARVDYAPEVSRA